MEKLTIHTDTEAILHQKCNEIDLPLDNEIITLGKSMVDYLVKSQDKEYASKNDIRPGVGIAAPQVGYLIRMFAIYFTNKEKDKDITYKYCLVNPKVISTSTKLSYLANGEGCLSVPKDVPGYVYRYYRFNLKAFDILSNDFVDLKLIGYPAIVFQHEYDHLQGILYYDRIDKNNPFIEDPKAIKIN